ncbi:hypothetical protein MLD52_12555 [Puniceicoccaceae bacterium K14]|nr:hypothetical protein [Puniceicoccaceae bacterium K14]
MTTVFTLFEKLYHHGVAALLNSLAEQGFEGRFIGYYRGSLPEWAFEVNQFPKKIEVIFKPLDSESHFAYLKPKIAKALISEFPDTDSFFYFDPDIVIIGPWEFFERWSRCGFALVEEIVNCPMVDNHPIRIEWCDWLKKHQINCSCSRNHYYNSGFFGYGRNHEAFFDLWSKIINLSSSDSSRNGVVDRRRHNLFSTWDQDALNVALMACEIDVAQIGPEGMGFIEGGYTMLHATGSRKPWTVSFFKEAIRGYPPKRVEREFIKYSLGPIQSFQRFTLTRKIYSLRIAQMIGRFYRA